MLIQFISAYHYFGLWDEGMCKIDENGKLNHLENTQEPLMEVHGQFSSKDALHVFLFDVGSEEDLVYMSQGCKTDKLGISRFVEIELTFNQKSVKHIEKVLKSLREIYSSRLTKLNVKVVQTFETKKDDLDDWIREEIEEKAVA